MPTDVPRFPQTVSGAGRLRDAHGDSARRPARLKLSCSCISLFGQDWERSGPPVSYNRAAAVSLAAPPHGGANDGRPRQQVEPRLRVDGRRQAARNRPEGRRECTDEKRSFSQDPGLAAAAGRRGSGSVPGEKRSFSRDPELAAEAGRKGGHVSGGNFAHNRESAVEAGRRGGQS